MRLPAALALLALAGCVFGRAPLPSDVQDLVDYLEARNLRLVPAEVAYDRAFETVDAEAHVVTYSVTATQPRSQDRRLAGALLDVYQFDSEAALTAGLAGLRRIHARGDLYVRGTTVLYVRGDAPDLAVALGRRFGVPIPA